MPVQRVLSLVLGRNPGATDTETLPVKDKAPLDLERSAADIGCAGRRSSRQHGFEGTARRHRTDCCDFAAAHYDNNLCVGGFVGSHHVAAVGKGVTKGCHIPLGGITGGEDERRIHFGLGIQFVGGAKQCHESKCEEDAKIFDRCHRKKKGNMLKSEDCVQRFLIADVVLLCADLFFCTRHCCFFFEKI